MAITKIFLRRGKEESLQRRHPWIFSGAIYNIEGNAELAEELAFALLSKIYDINSLMGVWSTESNEMVAYAALMAASRNERTTSEVAFIAAEKAVRANPNSVYIANGVVTLICYIASRDKSVKVGIPTLLERKIVEELEWQLEYL